MNCLRVGLLRWSYLCRRHLLITSTFSVVTNIKAKKPEKKKELQVLKGRSSAKESQRGMGGREREVDRAVEGTGHTRTRQPSLLSIPFSFSISLGCFSSIAYLASAASGDTLPPLLRLLEEREAGKGG